MTDFDTQNITRVVQTPRETWANLTAWFKQKHPGGNEEWLIAINNILFEHKRRISYVDTKASFAADGFKLSAEDRQREPLYETEKKLVVYVSRALYDALYDDVERYRTSLREIIIWRLNIATGNGRPSSLPSPPLRMSHKPKKRVEGRTDRSIEILWSMRAQQYILQVTRDVAKESGSPRRENYAEIARDLLYQQYGLKE